MQHRKLFRVGTAPQLSAYLEAVDVGQIDIEHDQIRRVGFGQRLRAGGGFNDLEAGGPQYSRGRVKCGRIVIHRQDADSALCLCILRRTHHGCDWTVLYRRGMRTENREPFPSSLSANTWPPRSSENFLARDSPNPVPRRRLRILVSSCTKSENSADRCSGAM